MKKKFFLLFALTILCVLSFVFGSVAVFAEESNQNSTDYSTLWTNPDATVTKEDNGVKLDFTSSGSAVYAYTFKIGQGSEVVVSAKEFTSEDNKEIFSVKLVSSSNGTDEIKFIVDGEKFKAQLGDNEEKFVNIDTLDDISISVVSTKVFVNGQELGDSNITVGYTSLTVTANTASKIYLHKINHEDFSDDVLTSELEWYYDDDCFINRGYQSVTASEYEGLSANAIIGFDYSVSDVTFFGTTYTTSHCGVVYYKATDIGTEITWGKELTYRPDENIESPTVVRFPSEGLYKVVVKSTDEEQEKVDAIVKYYKVVGETDEETLKYIPYDKNDAEIKEKYEDIAKEIINQITDQSEGNEGQLVSIGTNFYYPKTQIYKIIESKFFDVAQATSNSPVNYTLYYLSGTSTSDFTSTTSSYFELSAMSTYVFFVMPKDTYGNGYNYDTTEFEEYSINYYDTVEDVINTETQEKISVKIGAWEDKNGDFILPVFSFDITDNKAPEITVGYEQSAFIGQQYRVSSITINATNYTAEYKLYFMSEENYNNYKDNKLNNNPNKKAFNKDSFGTDREYYDMLLELIDNGYITTVKYTSDVDDADEIGDAFDKTNLTFYPNKGYYYMVCTVDAENGLSDTVVTYAIAALEEPTSVSYESEWWKHNWKSVMYLSISGVSLIAIILLLFVKPKKKSDKNINDEV